jgi:hypothetical protein
MNNSNKENLKEVAIRQVEYLLFHGPPKIVPSTPKNDPILAMKKRNTLNRQIKDYEEFLQPTNQPNIVLKNILAKKVADTFHYYKEKYGKNFDDDSIISNENEKDPVKVEYDKIMNLDVKTKQIYANTSKKTLDLLSSLNFIKNKNNLIFGKIKADKNAVLPASADVFANLFDDEDATIENIEKLDKTISSDVGKPLLNKLKTKALKDETINFNASPEPKKKTLLEKIQDKKRREEEAALKEQKEQNEKMMVKMNHQDDSDNESPRKRDKNVEMSPREMIRKYVDKSVQKEIKKDEAKVVPITKNNANIDISSNDINKSSNFGNKEADKDKDLFKSLNDVYTLLNRKLS